MGRINRFGKVFKADFSGDTCIAEFEPGVKDDRVELAQQALTNFIERCIKQYGSEPPVFAKRLNDEHFTPFNPKADRVDLCESVMIQPSPLVGG